MRQQNQGEYIPLSLDAAINLVELDWYSGCKPQITLHYDWSTEISRNGLFISKNVEGGHLNLQFSYLF